jgi:prefoldin subunit 5
MRGLGKNLNELKHNIQKIQEELSKIEAPEQPHPEIINTTNLLRANEYFAKSDEKKTALIAAYTEYAKQMEEILKSMFSIQSDLRDIIKTEASIIGMSGNREVRKKPKNRKKSKK